MATRSAAGARIHRGWAVPTVGNWGRLTDVRVAAPIAALLILGLLVVLPLLSSVVAMKLLAGTVAW